jgi:hypothetical protein
MVPLQAYEATRWRGVRSADYCLQSLIDPESGRRVRSFLYDLTEDPRETRDVSGRLPRVLAEHVELEDAWFEQAGGREAGVDLRDDPEMMRRLRSLGYVQ